MCIRDSEQTAGPYGIRGSEPKHRGALETLDLYRAFRSRLFDYFAILSVDLLCVFEAVVGYAAPAEVL